MIVVCAYDTNPVSRLVRTYHTLLGLRNVSDVLFGVVAVVDLVCHCRRHGASRLRRGLLDP